MKGNLGIVQRSLLIMLILTGCNDKYISSENSPPVETKIAATSSPLLPVQITPRRKAIEGTKAPVTTQAFVVTSLPADISIETEAMVTDTLTPLPLIPTTTSNIDIPTQAPTVLLPSPAPPTILLSNIRATSFTVSWVGSEPSSGYVAMGNIDNIENYVYDDRGETYLGITHHVTLTDLQPNATCYFDIINGYERLDNDGSHFHVTLGSTLELPASDTVYGQIFFTENEPAEGAIVYITIQDQDGLGSQGASSLATALIDTDGYWYTNLGNIRTVGLNDYFHYSPIGDSLQLQVYIDPNNQIQTMVDTASDAPAATIFVGK